MTKDFFYLSERTLLIVAAFCAVVFVGTSFKIVETQYAVRSVTAEIDRAERVRQQLLDEASALELELAQTALPKSVTGRAQEMGFVNAEVTDTLIIEVDRDKLEKERVEVRQ